MSSNVLISKVVAQHVHLRRQGREWRGRSPFSELNGENLFVSDEKNFFHDFATGKSGDAVAFLRALGLDEGEARNRIATIGAA